VGGFDECRKNEECNLLNMVPAMILGSSMFKGLYFYPRPLWITITIEISANSPCLWASFHPPPTLLAVKVK
jgi:hypothetical protein